MEILRPRYRRDPAAKLNRAKVCGPAVVRAPAKVVDPARGDRTLAGLDSPVSAPPISAGPVSRANGLEISVAQAGPESAQVISVVLADRAIENLCKTSPAEFEIATNGKTGDTSILMTYATTGAITPTIMAVGSATSGGCIITCATITIRDSIIGLGLPGPQ